MPQFMIAARDLLYTGRKITAGQSFSVCEPDVRILKDAGLAAPYPDDDLEPRPDNPDPEPESVPDEPVKRRRGRPRKLPS